MQPHTVYSIQKELLQTCYWKLKVNPTYVADFAKWTLIIVPVTQRLRGHQLHSKKIAGAKFLPWQFKIPCQHVTSTSRVVGLCQTVVTSKWNDCASFCVVVTVFQIVSVTEGTELLEQSFLSFHCHICCFISRSAGKFPCHITVVDVWNSTHVVLIVKCVFVLKMVCFLSFWRSVHCGGKSVWY